MEALKERIERNFKICKNWSNSEIKEKVEKLSNRPRVQKAYKELMEKEKNLNEVDTLKTTVSKQEFRKLRQPVHEAYSIALKEFRKTIGIKEKRYY